MKPVVGYLRSLGLLSTIYLDDIICLAHMKNVYTTLLLQEIFLKTWDLLLTLRKAIFTLHSAYNIYDLF